ncbi:hypothetical protein HRbin36_00802 [bacterium HR36]|uniref:Hypothetical conserved protein n=1 Tax=uncultured Planctomycetota bacterium TaxID=120965 RepID=H5SCV2_9BACT|nr:hypothetical conserved protein [uncultured Planctomycetota bacterium]BAL57166.1 hypothetical conserved protein [uncultured Planctomycetota bacterium]GBD35688.1 hypothetical protein HRbin36_00802 [bacterium HR36]
MSEKPPTLPGEVTEIRVYGHSMIFYFWPLWFFGYIFGFYTWLSDTYLLPVNRQELEKHGEMHVTIIKEDGASVIKARLGDPGQKDEQKKGREFLVRERVAASKNPGVLYALLLLLVIFITNVPLRGLYSLVALLLVIALALLFAYMDWWEVIFSWFGRLSIHMNMGFYIFFSTVLFILWAFAFFVYDRLSYWEIARGQVRHVWWVTGAVKSYDTTGMHFDKLRDDLFRHIFLGFGSGDLVMTPGVRAPDVSPEELTIRNVLLIGPKLKRILRLIAERPE